MAVLFHGMLCCVEGRAVMFFRGGETRQQLFRRMVERIEQSHFSRMVVFPEGTRKSHTVLKDVNDAKQHLRMGVLKCIYENKKYPVQIIISKNKEKAIYEKRLQCERTTITTAMGKPIYPDTFDSFEDWIDAISAEWYRLWILVYGK